MADDLIRDVRVATILAPLPTPVVFGSWVMRHREFALCAVRSEAGVVGRAFTYTRDGPIAAIGRPVDGCRAVRSMPMRLTRSARPASPKVVSAFSISARTAGPALPMTCAA